MFALNMFTCLNMKLVVLILISHFHRSAISKSLPDAPSTFTSQSATASPKANASKIVEEIDPLKLALINAEASFDTYFGLKTTNKAKVAREFVKAIDLIVVEMCREIQNGSKGRKRIHGMDTAIDLMCVSIDEEDGGHRTNWSIAVNSNSSWNTFGKPEPVEIILDAEDWTPCENGTADNATSCYGTVRHLDRCTGLQIFEGLVVTHNDTVKAHVNDTGSYAGNAENIIRTDGLLGALGSMSMKCVLPNETSELENFVKLECGLPNKITKLQTLANSSTCDFTSVLNGDFEFECSCSNIGFYREIYFDEEADANCEVSIKPNYFGFSFWLNFLYLEKAQSSRKDLEASLLSQILNATNFEENASWTQQLTLKLIPRNNNNTLLVLNFVLKSNHTRPPQVFEQLQNRIDELLQAGKLILANEVNDTLPIRIQRLIRNVYGEEMEDPPKNGMYLWFVFGVIILIAAAFIVVAVRKHQSEAEDSVEPITYRPDDLVSMSGAICPRRCDSGGNLQNSGFASARSMTTILSESTDASEDEGNASVENVSVVGRVGMYSYEHEESPRPIPSAFQVSSASRPVLVTDEDEMERIYYIPPPVDGEDSNSAFP